MRQSNGATTLDFMYDAGGTAIGFKYNSASYYYLRNVQGDVMYIANASGTIVAGYTYDAWGAPSGTYAVGPNGLMIAIMNPIRYRGYYYDTETGFYFLQTRYYDPQVKRFISADCLFVAGDAITGANMYAYCNGNPVMLVDPSGMGVLPTEGLTLGILLAGVVLVCTNVLGLSDSATMSILTGIGHTATAIGNILDAINFLDGFLNDLLSSTPAGGEDKYVKHWYGDEWYISHATIQNVANIIALGGNLTDLGVAIAAVLGASAPVLLPVLAVVGTTAAVVGAWMLVADKGNGVIIRTYIGVPIPIITRQ